MPQTERKELKIRLKKKRRVSPPTPTTFGALLSVSKGGATSNVYGAGSDTSTIGTLAGQDIVTNHVLV